MQTRLHKKSILKKTAEVGVSSLISKCMGIVREILQNNYFGGPGAISDAFNIAYRIPNLFRKIFAEGALSAAFIPTLVKVVKTGKYDQANKLMTILLLSIGTVVLLLCIPIFLFPKQMVLLAAPGFASKPLELETALPLVRILIFFIFFISVGAMLAGAMQAKQHFAVPAWGPVLLNIVYISGLLICSRYNLSVATFCFFLLLGGLSQVIFYSFMYFKLDYRFEWPNKESLGYFKEVMYKFIPCVFTVSALEINLFIDSRFASYLPAGSITLVNLAFRFMTITLSAFAAAFSSILLSHFSRVTTYAPKRLSFYLLEATKFIFWITIPATLFMSFFAYDIFYTAFYQLSDNFTLEQVNTASHLLIIFVSVLFFYSINKLFLSIYYSLHETVLPTVISFIGTLCNVLFNYFFISKLGVISLAIATSLSAVIQSILFALLLYKKFNFVIYLKQFGQFLLKSMLKVTIVSILFYVLYKLIVQAITVFLPTHKTYLLEHIGLWLWVGPLSLFLFGLLYILRKPFKIKMYFLE